MGKDDHLYPVIRLLFVKFTALKSVIPITGNAIISLSASDIKRAFVPIRLICYRGMNFVRIIGVII